MNTFLIILAVILALIGIAGSIVPGLPGPPLSWAAVLVLSFTDMNTQNTNPVNPSDVVTRYLQNY